MAKQETAKFQKAQLNTTAFYRRYRDIYLNFGTNKTEGNKGIDLVAIGLHDFMSSQANVFNTERTPAGVWLGSVRNLAQLAGLPRPRVERAIKQLESADLIKHFPLAGQKTAFMVDGFEVAKFKYYETWWVAAAQTDNWESPSGVSVS